jgi:hypothetical protein
VLDARHATTTDVVGNVSINQRVARDKIQPQRVIEINLAREIK